MADENPPSDASPPSEEHQASDVEELTLAREQLEEALREKDQFRTIAQRAQADLVNYRRRAAEEQDELRRTANSDLILKMLSVVDDLNRALALVPEGSVAQGWLEGLRLVQRNLDQILGSEGMTRIEAEGQPFEPREHEAVLYEETPGAQEGMVVRVIREGYKLHDRVLRAAQVAVSRPTEAENQPEETQQEA